MTRPIIPILPQESHESPVRPPVVQPDMGAPVLDRLGRPLKDLRISVTDRCNFRCVYCMPKQVFGKDFRFIPHSDMLSFEEIARIARLFVAQGVEKIRLTGGEPLMRKNVERLIGQLSRLETPEGKPVDLTLTTNGSMLAKKAQTLYDAGLKRITVSLDALDDTVFRKMNDVDFSVKDVLHGIDTALAVGFEPVKVNTVVKKGLNESQVLPIARHFKNSPVIVRFIEYMDVGSSNDWEQKEIIPSEELAQLIDAEMPIEPIDRNYAGETAERWRYRDGSGEIGFIASVTKAFCQDCSRIRLSTEGKLYKCLFATEGYDIRFMIRDGWSDNEISTALAQHWQNRDNRYSELRAQNAIPVTGGKKIEMSYIGG